MKILAIEKAVAGATMPDYTPFLRAEAMRVWELMQEGVVREAWFDSDHNAILVLECDNADAARECLATLPLVQHGLIAFEVRALHPYDGLSRLFV